MIELTKEATFIIFAVLGAGYWYTWRTAHEKGYVEACTDVALGNIEVGVTDESDHN